MDRFLPPFRLGHDFGIASDLRAMTMARENNHVQETNTLICQFPNIDCMIAMNSRQILVPSTIANVRLNRLQSQYRRHF